MIILACLIPEEQGNIPTHFTNWPLHLTLIPWFKISGKELPKFLTAVESIASNYGPIQLKQEGSTNFSTREVRVTLIRPTSEIINLHQDLLLAISDSNALILSSRYTGSNFRPHITEQAGRSLPEAKVIISHKLYLITKEFADQRQIVHDIEFSKTDS